MAIIKISPIIGDIEGILGDMVFAKHKPGYKIARKRPVRTAPPTEGEKVNQSRMASAIAWAKGIWANQPALKVQYVTAGQATHRRAFDIAKADFLRAPTVANIELSGYTGKKGELIRVEALDDFEVTGVQVSIRDLDDAVLEQGAAAQDGNGWVYKATVSVLAGQTVVIEATATDHPGHSGTRKVDHACGPRS